MVEEDDVFRIVLERLAQETGSTLVVGSVGGSGGGPYANSVFAIAPGRAARGGLPRYDKTHLVPYGEYVPLARLTPFVRRFVDAIGEFEPGGGPVVWEVDGVRATPLICYEAIFPAIARRAVAAGGELLLNVTNDAWYGRIAGPQQHLALVRMRAVETGRPLVRAANTGISAIFDARGRLLGSEGMGESGVVVAEVVLDTGRTPYLLLGDSLPICCAIITLVLIVFLFLRARREREPGGEDNAAATGPR
jgi:apolipoprotein N-acyltransferase